MNEKSREKLSEHSVLISHLVRTIDLWLKKYKRITKKKRKLDPQCAADVVGALSYLSVEMACQAGMELELLQKYVATAHAQILIIREREKGQ